MQIHGEITVSICAVNSFKRACHRPRGTVSRVYTVSFVCMRCVDFLRFKRLSCPRLERLSLKFQKFVGDPADNSCSYTVHNDVYA